MTSNLALSSEPIYVARFGHILELHPEMSKVRIDFEGNNAGEPVWASLGRLFSQSHIQLAIDNELACKVEFYAGDASLPIVTDIFFSVLEENSLVIRAKNVLLNGSEKVTLQSESASTEYCGRTGKVTTKAKFITSNAEKTHKIQAQKIDLN
ncbi:hypothetical protein [Vibrio caribbeanicus]|uniref:hypothetical protein n=1 Tax=Vibrio caribbeanicus TaxID=701175 RepID=UPI0030DCEDFB